LKRLQEKADFRRLGLYLHVPFCARACDFCNFYQKPPRRGELERYLDGMELAFGSLSLKRRVETVFWGGGTPGLLPVRDLERLGKAVLKANQGHPPAEWTVEMAPATVKADKLACLRELGVNRISMGVQSFQSRYLEALGRLHSLEQVHRAIDLLHESAIGNFNLDLIFAIPGQPLADWRADLQRAIASGATHISTYCLTFEEDTALWLRLQKGQVEKLDVDDEARYYETSCETLSAAGFRQYEISNFARPGYACEHNLNTWRMHDWVGIGPSASSQVGLRRWTEAHSLDEWLDGVNSAKPAFLEDTVLSPEMLAADYLVFGLRMNEGVDLNAWEQRFPDSAPAGWKGFVGDLVEEGLAECRDKRLSLTARGRLVADRIGSEILRLAGQDGGPI